MKCWIQNKTTFFFPDKNSRHLFLHCNFTDCHNKTKPSKLRRHTKANPWAVSSQNALIKNKKSIPEGGITQCRISKIIIIIHQYAWLNHSLRLIFPFCFIDQAQTKTAGKCNIIIIFSRYLALCCFIKTALVRTFEQMNTDKMSMDIILYLLYTLNAEWEKERTCSLMFFYRYVNLGISDAQTWATMGIFEMTFHVILPNQCDNLVKWRFYWPMRAIKCRNTIWDGRTSIINCKYCHLWINEIEFIRNSINL